MGDLARTAVSNYTVSWGDTTPYDFGFIDDTDVDLKLKLKEIKVGTLGDVVLGQRIIALEGSIKVKARELDEAYLRKVWAAAPATGSIPLIPTTAHKDLYDLAQILRLHPTSHAANAKDEDIVLVKAVPLLPKRKRDGEADDSDDIEFIFFPDRTKFPVLDYGWIGDAHPA